MDEIIGEKKMKILCLHGFRTSGSFLKKQLSKWDPSIFAHFEMEFPDGIFAAGGKSDIEGIFPPPYFEWFQYNESPTKSGFAPGSPTLRGKALPNKGDSVPKGARTRNLLVKDKEDFTEYENLEECISYLCEYITSKGPFDGLLGFSQGATLSGLLLGYMEQGKILKEHPPMKLFVSISGAKFRDPNICNIAYKDMMKVKSVHFIGEKDWLKLPSQELTTAFENPLIIRHPQGHTVPRLGNKELKIDKSRLLRWYAPSTSNSEVRNFSHQKSKKDETAMETLKTWTREIGFYSNESCVGGGPNEACKHVNIENGVEEGKKLEMPNEVEIQKAQE
ncbi:hypothetical protein H5410_032663 [Solanum commersonii]|uniref:Serine hydrolase domain-containing protein n=1 Tax=Solanum commersonii TaxID=4109 RepID=A0A9J5YMW2_SOLCO|nr:hypothetical protein H5410_032663 [Solanum commersonii]